MKIVEPYAKIISLGGYTTGVDLLRHIERCARVCYRSEGAQTEDSYKRLLPSLLASGHMSVFEHGSITAEFLVSRGVSHELVRHRLCAFSQESQRFVSYDKDKFGGGIKVIKPEGMSDAQDNCWTASVEDAEMWYFSMLDKGAKPQIARDVLPNACATVVEVSANPREWRHVLLMRTSKAAHPEFLRVSLPLLESFKLAVPILYDDIEPLAEPAVNARLVH
jgi:thymidylate synthase (FAD)